MFRHEKWRKTRFTFYFAKRAATTHITHSVHSFIGYSVHRTGIDVIFAAAAAAVLTEQTFMKYKHPHDENSNMCSESQRMHTQDFGFRVFFRFVCLFNKLTAHWMCDVENEYYRFLSQKLLFISKWWSVSFHAYENQLKYIEHWRFHFIFVKRK